jgi:hypothetical protein
MKALIIVVLTSLLSCQTVKCPRKLGCNNDCYRIVLPIGAGGPIELVHGALEMNMALKDPDEYYRREREAMGCPEPNRKKKEEKTKYEASHFPTWKDYRPKASEETH